MVNNSWKYAKKVEPEEYIDLAFRNILDINKHVYERENVDLKSLKQLKIILVNELENFSIGAGLINKKSRSINFDNLDEHDEKLLIAAKEYYNKKYGYQGGVLDRVAKAMLKESIEGDYDAKIKHARKQLEASAKDKGWSDDFVELQLANYKIQVILSQITRRKPKSVDLAAGIDVEENNE